MLLREWKNDALNIHLTIEYDPFLVVRDSNNNIVSYQVRDCHIYKRNLFGASFKTNLGFTILIINGTGLLTAASTVYEIPPGTSIDSITVPSQWNSNY
jgi:hypothetical protein